MLLTCHDMWILSCSWRSASDFLLNCVLCLFSWIEFDLLLFFFPLFDASLFKSQRKWPKLLWTHCKWLNRGASLTKAGVALGTVSLVSIIKLCVSYMSNAINYILIPQFWRDNSIKPLDQFFFFFSLLFFN